MYAREGGSVREGGRKCTRGRGSVRELYIISKFIFLHPRKKTIKISSVEEKKTVQFYFTKRNLENGESVLVLVLE